MALPDDETVQSFHDATHGEVLHPGDEGYTEAQTVWNAMIDKYPSLVVRCSGAADVMTAVDFAREHDILVSATTSQGLPSATTGW